MICNNLLRQWQVTYMLYQAIASDQINWLYITRTIVSNCALSIIPGATYDIYIYIYIYMTVKLAYTAC